jgi:hypothetical protein
MNADGSGSTRLGDGYDPSWQPTKVRMVDCLIPTPLSP